MPPTTLTLANVDYLFDPDVAVIVARLSEKGWRQRGNGLVFNARNADLARLPELRRNAPVTIATLMHLIVHGVLPPPDHAAQYLHGKYDLRRESVVWRPTSDLAREHLNLPERRDPDAGIEQTKSGKFRVRTFINGQQRALGTYPDRATAVAVRDDALAHLERYPRPLVRRGNMPPEGRYTLMQALAALSDARVRIRILESEVVALTTRLAMFEEARR